MTAALDAYSETVVRVAETVLPSVASLRITTRRSGGRHPVGAGSAVTITADGFLLTSAHVVRAGDSGTATFGTGREETFELAGLDELSDLAVIRVAADVAPTVVMGDADSLRVGQLVIAVGNPLGYDGSVSAGVVSGLRRSMIAGDGRNARIVEDVIQTDASLHPGNSGGALADHTGALVGISTAVVGPGFGQGLGLAVPINATSRVLIAQLIREGRVRRAYLGIAGAERPLPPNAVRELAREREATGLEIASLVRGGAAERAGLKLEDIILSIDGTAVTGMGSLQRHLDADRIGRAVTLEIFRGGRVRRIDVVPDELGATTAA